MEHGFGAISWNLVDSSMGTQLKIMTFSQNLSIAKIQQ